MEDNKGYLFALTARNSPIQIRKTSYHENFISLGKKIISFYKDQDPKSFVFNNSFERFFESQYLFCVYELRDNENIRKIKNKEIYDQLLKVENQEIKKELVKLKLKHNERV